MNDPFSVRISRLGAQGDGVAEGAGGSVFVPFALPGEELTAAISGGRTRLVSVEKQSPDRVAPICRHFGTCGGCALQHMKPAAYQAWKRQLVIEAFGARGIETNVGALVIADGLRRRATFSAVRKASGVSLGFHEAGTHDLIDIAECPVVEPQIFAAIPGIKALILPLMSGDAEMRVSVTRTDGGLDVAIDATKKSLTPDLRSAIARAAAAAKLARVSIAGDPVYESGAPFLRFGLSQVVPPPASFLQAVADAETKMTALIVAALGKAKTVVDLFSGAGAFTFPVAERAKVLAADSDKEAIAALVAASKKTPGLKPIQGLVRDLFREPLSALELNEHDAIVFDPPRAGAEAQARMIAKSKVKTVVAVSCNPATLARDVRILIDGGYKLESVTPIDQFHFTPHVETVAVLRR
jgi:23S rRNA (uracil1939-C5)-methyltransferase